MMARAGRGGLADDVLEEGVKIDMAKALAAKWRSTMYFFRRVCPHPGDGLSLLGGT